MAHLQAVRQVNAPAGQAFDVSEYFCELQMLLARISMHCGDWSRAHEELLKAIAADPKSRRARDAMVDWYCATDKSAVAIAYLEQRVRDEVDGYIDLYRLGASLHRACHFKVAGDVYRRASALDTEEIVTELATRQLSLLDSSQPRIPDDAILERRRLEGSKAAISGKPESGLAQVMMFLACVPDHAVSWFLVGYVHQQVLCSTRLLQPESTRGEPSVFRVLTECDETRAHLRRACFAYRMEPW
jgi:Tfp pilus assembly protein PilF